MTLTDEQVITEIEVALGAARVHRVTPAKGTFDSIDIARHFYELGLAAYSAYGICPRCHKLNTVNHRCDAVAGLAAIPRAEHMIAESHAERFAAEGADVTSVSGVWVATKP